MARVKAKVSDRWMEKGREGEKREPNLIFHFAILFSFRLSSESINIKNHIATSV